MRVSHMRQMLGYVLRISTSALLLVALSPGLGSAQNDSAPEARQRQTDGRQVQAFDVAGNVWTVLPNGETIRGAGATIYVWPHDPIVTKLFGSACMASALDPKAWLVARTEFADSTGLSLGDNARLDLQLLHTLASLPHASGRADSAGHFVVRGLTDGFYWFEAEMMVGSKIMQWWKSATFVHLPIAGVNVAGAEVNIGPRHSTYLQFCTTPEPGIGAAAFVDDRLPAALGQQVYLPIDVDQPAAPVAGTAPPVYPKELLQAHITGAVTVRFVVDTTGRVQMSTLRVVRSDYPAFTAAVRWTLLNARYQPAMLRGVKVNTINEQSFRFTFAQELVPERYLMHARR